MTIDLIQIADELQGIPDSETKISVPCPVHGELAATISLVGPENLQAACPQCETTALWRGLVAGSPTLARLWAEKSKEKEDKANARALRPEVKQTPQMEVQPPPRPETQQRRLDRNPPTPSEETALAPLFSNVPPQAIDSEKVVLGSIFFRPSTIDIVSSIINPTDFIQESHREIFKVMLELAAVGKLARDPEAPIDVLTVQRELDKRHLLEATGGAEYIGRLAAAMPTAYYAPQHARYIREAALKRDYMRQGGALVTASSNGSTLPELKALAAQILKIEDLSGEDPYIDRHAIDAFEAYKVSRADQRGYSWGGLIRWGTTGLVSALMGSGKTTFSLCLSRAWALGEEFLGKQCATSKTLAVVSPKEYEAWIETVGFWGLEGAIFIVPSHYAHFGNPQKTAEWFVSEMRRCDCRTFVLDTLFDFYGMPQNQSGDENRKVMTEQTPLLEAVRENGWSGLVTGHAPKSEAQTETPRDPEEAFAGHSAWAAQHRMRITIRRRSNDMKTIVSGRGGFGDEGILEERVLLFDKETRLDSLGGLFSKQQGEAAWPEVRRVLDAIGTGAPVSKIVKELNRSEKFVRPGLREGRRLKLVVIEGKGKATRYRLAGPNDNQTPPGEPAPKPEPEDDTEQF